MARDKVQEPTGKRLPGEDFETWDRYVVGVDCVGKDTVSLKIASPGYDVGQSLTVHLDRLNAQLIGEALIKRAVR